MLLIEDVLIAARTIYGEARGEPYEGKKAIAHVLINRWERKDGQFGRDDTLATACLRHLQFTAWSESDPNFAAMFKVTADDPAFRASWRAVLEAIDEPDPTKGATHYHTIAKPSYASAWPPVWADKHVPSATIGHHLFYNDVP